MPKLLREDTSPTYSYGNKVRLAICLFDLDRLSEFIREAMGLADKLDVASGAIRIDPDRPDETAVAFRCDLLTAACLCDVMRGHDRKAGDYPTRVYLSRGKGWTKLSGDTVLTEVVGSKPRLNPKIFGGTEVVAPKPVKVF